MMGLSLPTRISGCAAGGMRWDAAGGAAGVPAGRSGGARGAAAHGASRCGSVVVADAKLESERGRAVRVLLRVFERRAAMQTLAAG